MRQIAILAAELVEIECEMRVRGGSEPEVAPPPMAFSPEEGIRRPSIPVCALRVVPQGPSNPFLRRGIREIVRFPLPRHDV